MEKFVSLVVVGKTGSETLRLFNLRYVKSIEPLSSSVLLYGNYKPFKVKPESMRLLLEALRFYEEEDVCP